MSRVLYADPAGNITAIVRGAASEDRADIVREILKQNRAEQVGFEVQPQHGACGRLEMMGGEFCGNAARSFGFLKAAEQWESGVHTVGIEISGAEQIVSVCADLDAQTAFAQMPLPLECCSCEVDGFAYPVVRMEGISHLIAENTEPSELFVSHALAAAKKLKWDAFGILFLQKNHMTPVVYVKQSDSLVWESSCGSGSLACGWYLAKRMTGPIDGKTGFAFSQPGGRIDVELQVKDGTVLSATMGGSLRLSVWTDL